MKNFASRRYQTNGSVTNFDKGEAISAPLISRAQRGGAADQLRSVNVAALPLLKVQRLSLGSHSVMAVCPDVRTAQRYFCEAAQALESNYHHFVLHELMPEFQQEYILDCLRGAQSFAVECPVVVFVSAGLYQDLAGAEAELLASFKIVEISNRAGGGLRGSLSDEPSVRCICLRTGQGGRWLLMDHDEAAVVSQTAVPSEDLVERLMRHTVQISGNYLAPYLAMMFDVPPAWKNHPELSSCALLVFKDDRCDTGCLMPGIPAKIIWNDVLGIVCGE